MVDLSKIYDTDEVFRDSDYLPPGYVPGADSNDDDAPSINAPEAFRDDMMKNLGYAPRVIIGDGKVQRFPTKKNGHDDAGWCVLYDDEFPAGSYGNWRTGESFKWCARETSEMSPIERQRLEHVKAKREREAAEDRAKAIKSAQRKWTHSAPADADHPYLVKKGVKPHELRKNVDGRLLAPVFINGVISSLQYIDAEGGKRFETGAPTKGGYCVIGDIADKLIIAEGFATAATLYEATGIPTVVASNAGNLQLVAEKMREDYPAATITFAADDDYCTELERGFNPGLRAAEKASESVGAEVMVPLFDREAGEEGTDYNDLCSLRGRDAVAEAFGVWSRAAETNKTPATPATFDPRRPEKSQESQESQGVEAPATNPVQQAQQCGEEPRPLFRPLPPAAKYPIDALGDVLAPAARAIMDRVQCPDALAAQSVLAVAGLAVQAFADVRIPATGHAKPVSLDLLSVAATGERKSAADSDALRPVRKYEKALREAFSGEMKEYLAAKKAWDAAEAKTLRSQNGGYGETKKSLSELGEAPIPPVFPMKTCEEPTYEGLCKALDIGQPSMGLFSDEGGMFVSGHGMSPENRLRTLGGLSKLWDGAPIKRVRSIDGSSIIAGKRLAVHLMAQPDAAARLLSDPVAQDQGFLSRILAAAPDSTVGTRIQREHDPESKESLKRYNERIFHILEHKVPLAEESQNELEPRILPFDHEAAQAWRDFADHVEGLLAPGKPFEPIRGFANKLPEHAARIAAVLALIEDLHTSFIYRESFERAIVLAEFYAHEALRLFDSGSISPELRLAEALRNWLKSWGEPLIGLRAIYRLGPNSIRDAETAKAAIDVLVDHGWLTPIKGSATVEGKPVRKAWKIVRCGEL